MSTPTSEYLLVKERLLPARKERDAAKERLYVAGRNYTALLGMTVPQAIRWAKDREAEGTETNVSRAILLLAQDYIEAEQALTDIQREVDNVRAQEFHLEFEETA